MTKKLSAKWTGPYEVTNVRGVNLALKQPAGDVWVHHNRLKLAFTEEPGLKSTNHPTPRHQYQDITNPPDEVQPEEEDTEEDDDTEEGDDTEDNDIEYSEAEESQEEVEDGTIGESQQEERALPQQEPTVTRSGRVVRPPQHFKDYVTDFK